MADTQTTVTTLDIQMLDADRSNATTIKLDNPKDNVTREQVSSAMQPAFSNGWFLCSNGNTAMYLGDVTINQSIKTKLAGEDFYVTPDTITMESGATTVTVSGATIQGYNLKDTDTLVNHRVTSIAIASNGLSITFSIEKINTGTENFTLVLIIQGLEINIPVTLN